MKLIFLKFLNFLGKIPILKEFEWFKWFEWFEWFGPSPIEPFNSAPVLLRPVRGQRAEGRADARGGAGPVAREGGDAELDRIPVEAEILA